MSVYPVEGKVVGNGQKDTDKDEAEQAFFHRLANSTLKARTAASGPSACSHTPAETARKSAPASTSAGALAAVMPPIATHGTTISSLHQRSSSSEAWVLGSWVRVGKKAPKAT